MNQIGFPGLGLSFRINPVAFSAFGKEVFWYGLIIATGLLLAVMFCIWEGKRVGLPQDTIPDVALFATPVAILFARLYFVAFTWRDYVQDPLSIFYIWEGGIAIYGAIIGGVLTAYVYCKRKKVDWRQVFDVGCFGLLIGQAIGRFGNFTNVEAFGGETTLPWRMEIINTLTGKPVWVHPTFLYESLWNVVGFAALFCYRKHKKFQGELFLLYVAWYGAGRMWIEQLRVDSLPYSAHFKVSQIVAIVTMVAAVILLCYNRNKAKREEELR